MQTHHGLARTSSQYPCHQADPQGTSPLSTWPRQGTQHCTPPGLCSSEGQLRMPRHLHSSGAGAGGVGQSTPTREGSPWGMLQGQQAPRTGHSCHPNTAPALRLRTQPCLRSTPGTAPAEPPLPQTHGIPQDDSPWEAHGQHSLPFQSAKGTLGLAVPSLHACHSVPAQPRSGITPPLLQERPGASQRGSSRGCPGNRGPQSLPPPHLPRPASSA